MTVNTKSRNPYYHGRFREDQMGENRWAIEFYSFTGAMKVIIVDHLSSREEAIDIRNALNDESGITNWIEDRKAEQRKYTKQ